MKANNHLISSWHGLAELSYLTVLFKMNVYSFKSFLSFCQAVV